MSINRLFPETMASIQSSSWVSIRYSVVSLCGLLVSIIFARFADKNTFAEYQFIMATLALFSIFSLPGLNFVALQAFVEGKRDVLHKVFR
jgi:O-antigen/teichoic acid export membrane protein